jgi:hypothetical protein
MAGYSGTPLPKKLGFKPGMRVRFVNEPADFRGLLGALEDLNVCIKGGSNLDLVMLFCKDRAALHKQFKSQAETISPTGMLWVGWPKKTSGVITDLTETEVREHGLACGLVDVKVCAISDVWSGLKFVVRLKDRPKA